MPYPWAYFSPSVLADALYWVDDYKTIYADEKTFTRFLQSYSRGMGRGRLTRDAKLRRERACRGLVMSTGETMITGEASVIARTVMLEIPPWEKRDPQGTALDAMEPLRGALSGFTVRFAQWIAEQVESHQLVKTLDHDFAENEQAYRTKLGGLAGRQASTGRIIQNWAVLVTVYRLLYRFLAEQNVAHVLLPWQDVIQDTVRAVQHERASEVFLDVLKQLLASGEVMLASNTQHPEQPALGKTVVGYLDPQYVYLLVNLHNRMKEA